MGQMLEHRVHPEAAHLWRLFAERQTPPIGTIVDHQSPGTEVPCIRREGIVADG